MRKAFLQSKWWFYIPIISIFFIKYMTEWVFRGEDSVDCTYRNIVIHFIIFIHILPLMFLISLL